jgi:hypothetical protein
MEHSIKPTNIKSLLLVILFVPAVHFAAAQHEIDTVLKSRLARFVDSPHTLLRTEQIDHGHILTCFVQIYKASDLVTGKVVSGLYFADNKNHYAYVDADEVPLLLTAMTRIKNEIIATPPTNHSEVWFKSRGGFRAGCYIGDKDQWQLFIQLTWNDAFSIIQLKTSDFDVFLQILADASGKLP